MRPNVERISTHRNAGPVYLGHKFGPDLTCPCGTTWRDHQDAPKQCTYDNGRCKRGHRMTPSNTYQQGSVNDGCIACRVQEARKRERRLEREKAAGEAS